MKYGEVFFGALFIVFLVLKLEHTIAWSWWWVSAPLWIPPVTKSALTVILKRALKS